MRFPQHKLVHQTYTWTLQYTGRPSFSFTGGEVPSHSWLSRGPTIHGPQHDLGYLRHQLNSIMEASIAPSTRNTYATGTRAYIHFCNQIGHSPFPLNQETLRLFVTSLYNRISYKSIKVYLVGIQYTSVLRCGSHTIENTRLLHYTLRGIRRLQGDQFKRQVRAHVTLGHLHHLHAYFDRHFIFVMLTCSRQPLYWHSLGS